MTEKPKDINQNPMPEFHLFAPRINPLELAARGLHQLASFVLDRHSIPKQTVDDMLLGETDGHER